MRNKLSWFAVPYVVWMAVIYVTVNLAVDVICRFLDPQTRLRGKVD